MSEPTKLVAFCGSLRKASFNRMALNAFIERLPAGTSAQIIEIDWPLYNADIQAQGFPDKVQAAQKAMLEADGLVLVTPEYNYGPSGVLKNAIDWLSRMTPQPFAAKPIAMFGASGGVLGSAHPLHRRQAHRRGDRQAARRTRGLAGSRRAPCAGDQGTREVARKPIPDSSSRARAARPARARGRGCGEREVMPTAAAG